MRSITKSQQTWCRRCDNLRWDDEMLWYRGEFVCNTCEQNLVQIAFVDHTVDPPRVSHDYARLRFWGVVSECA